MNLSKEIEIAKNVRKNSYSPYSKYYVGCALKALSGKIYSGCNIDNCGIQSICAERVAFSKAISEGEKDFEHIVICGGNNLYKLDNCLPCGYCRQFMNEFVGKNFKIYIITENDNLLEYSMDDLLPNSFHLQQ